jgi:predicted 2-oxoglutarate/Fe(II)-dependent dioxygenase YbiX/peroxiredoxin
MLLPGDPAPYFNVASSVSLDFHFDTVAGRYVVLSFFASSKQPLSTRLLDEVRMRRERFNVTDLVYFGVSADPKDRDRLPQECPGIVYFWDDDLAISVRYGAVPEPGRPGAVQVDTAAGPAGGPLPYRPRTVVLDQALRVLAIYELDGDPAAHLDEVLVFVDALPKLRSLNSPAPVLSVPYVFEPDLCRRLIDYYETHGGRDSGFMRDVAGKTVELMDYSHKQRRDCEVEDQSLVRATHQRLLRRVIPAIRQAFQFDATRIERTMVARYDAEEGGHFRAHRDNTTLGTAHRRFAVTLNLNSEEFEGGELWFPEFSCRRYKAPTGGAVVFSCSLLHEATPVTKGRRYAFLPFLYDDASAALRERNRQFVAAEASRASPNQEAGVAPKSTGGVHRIK